MPERRDPLTRYLLGVASETERTLVEEQCFSDDEGLDVLLRAEDELIDDYAAGVLSASDQQLFENHFLCTEGRRQRLNTVKSFVDVLGQMELRRRAVSSEPPQPSSDREKRYASSPIAIKHNQLTPEGFAKFLNWLDADYQKAGEKLENIRRRLVQLFTIRGVNDAEVLADATIDRVASKFDLLTKTEGSDPAIYFYGVAKQLMLEGARRSASVATREAGARIKNDASDREYACREKCLQRLSVEDRDLIYQYYGSSTQRRMDHRRQLAHSLGISLSALRIRTHRIRKILASCVESCLQRDDE